MRRKLLSLPPEQVTVNTAQLSDRWGVSRRTVIRVCRIHAVKEIPLVEGGRILYPRDDIEELEAKLFGWN